MELIFSSAADNYSTQAPYSLAEFVFAACSSALGLLGTQLAGSHCLMGQLEEDAMNSIIYIVGLIVVIGIILSFFGLR
jgi:hypothetical protein